MYYYSYVSICNTGATVLTFVHFKYAPTGYFKYAPTGYYYASKTSFNVVLCVHNYELQLHFVLELAGQLVKIGVIPNLAFFTVTT